MKKILLISFLFLSVNVFSQTYFPFPDSVGIWRQKSCHWAGDPFDPPNCTPYALFLNGDTLINGKLYSKLYKQNTIYTINMHGGGYVGALREMNKKVYYFPHPNIQSLSISGLCNSTTLNYNQEFLLYDFDVAVGDTVFYPDFGQAKMVITKIDSVEIQGQFRKRFSHGFISNTMGCWGATGGYVEGIGCVREGLFAHLIHYFENLEYLSCFEDDEVFHSNIADCTNPWLSIKESKSSNKLLVYPNPSHGVFTVALQQAPNNTQLSVFNTTGQLVLQQTATQTTTIDLTNMPKGLYLLQVLYNGQLISKRVIKN